jgi:hypothetical protein
MDDAKIQHRYLDFVRPFYELLLIAEVELVVSVFVQFIILLLKLRSLLSELRSLLQKL